MTAVAAFRPEGLADGELWVEDSGDAEYLDGICAQYAIKAVDPNGIDDTLAFCFNRQQAVLLAAAPEMRDLLQSISNWLVCEAIATPEDMAQSFSSYRAEIDALIAKLSA